MASAMAVSGKPASGFPGAPGGARQGLVALQAGAGIRVALAADDRLGHGRQPLGDAGGQAGGEAQAGAQTPAGFGEGARADLERRQGGRPRRVVAQRTYPGAERQPRADGDESAGQGGEQLGAEQRRGGLVLEHAERHPPGGEAARIAIRSAGQQRVDTVREREGRRRARRQVRGQAVGPIQPGLDAGRGPVRRSSDLGQLIGALDPANLRLEAERRVGEATVEAHAEPRERSHQRLHGRLRRPHAPIHVAVRGKSSTTYGEA
jgi:hypothetical protein